MRDMHQLQAKALRTLWTWSAYTPIHSPNHPYNGFQNKKPCPKLQSSAVSFQVWNKVMWAVIVWEWQHGSDWATVWTNRTKTPRCRVYHLQLQAIESLSHTGGTTIFAANAKFGKWHLKKKMFPAWVRMRMLCAKCCYKLTKFPRLSEGGRRWSGRPC